MKLEAKLWQLLLYFNHMFLMTVWNILCNEMLLDFIFTFRYLYTFLYFAKYYTLLHLLLHIHP